MPRGRGTFGFCGADGRNQSLPVRLTDVAPTYQELIVTVAPGTITMRKELPARLAMRPSPE